jgi:CRP-like cAMP-binding protein
LPANETETNQSNLDGKSIVAPVEIEYDVTDHITLTKEEETNLSMIKKFQKFEWFIDIKTMVEGETFGELALVKNDPRAATIKCDSDCYFGVIDKIDYDKFLKKVHNKTIQKDIDFLASLPFFNHWTVT